MENKKLYIDKCFYFNVFHGELDIEADYPDGYTFAEVTKEKAKEIIEFLQEFVGEE